PPKTPARLRLGSLAPVEFVLGLPLAAGSRYLKRQFTKPAGGSCETVVVKMAPCWLFMTFPLHRSGACVAPCQERMLFASPVGSQLVLPAGTPYVSVPRLTT